VNSSHVINESLTADDLGAGSVGSSEVEDNSLTAADLAAGSVGTSEVVDNSLTAADLAAGSVGASEVADNSLTAADIATDAVGAAELANNSVASVNVIDNSLTAIDLAPNSVGSSELGANAVGSGSIIDGAILNADISASADIEAVKILGIPGVEYNNSISTFSWTTGLSAIHSFGSITMDIPSNGFVVLTHCGFAVTYNMGRAGQVGVGTSATAMTRYTLFGGLNGTGTDDTWWPFSVTDVIPVTAGTRTFYALGAGYLTYTSGNLFIRKDSFIGIFIPVEY